MKCVHQFGTGRHKRQADITLLFQYRYLQYKNYFNLGIKTALYLKYYRINSLVGV